MRLKNVPGSREAIADSVFVIHEPETNKGAWQQVFGNDHEIHVEIGMGKGRFLYEMASLHPDINYIGIEKYSSVLLRAIQKMEERSFQTSALSGWTLRISQRYSEEMRLTGST